MKVRVHRGTQEIGGTCIELDYAGQRLVLDVGRPLDSDPKDEVTLPDVPGLASGDDPNLVGLILSHGHQDHWGLIGQVSPQVPVYIGEACAAMLRAAVFFSAAGIDLHPAGHLGHRKPLQVGPFTVTPFLNDHNGFDAYSMLVEAGGKKLFYSGDFQGHGRKSDLFEEMLRKPPTGVDVMLMEGTNLQDGAEKATPGPTENDIEAAIVNQAADTAGMVLVTYSAQNIDRLVTLYRAAKRSNRHLVLDLYTAAMAEATGNKNIPKPGWDRVLVYVPQSQRVKVLHS